MKHCLQNILFVIFHLVFGSFIGLLFTFNIVFPVTDTITNLPVIKTIISGEIFILLVILLPYFIKFSFLPVFYLTAGDNKFISGVFNNLLNPQKRLLTLFYILLFDVIINYLLIILFTPKDEVDIFHDFACICLCFSGGGVFLCYIVFLIWHRIFIKNKIKNENI